MLIPDPENPVDAPLPVSSAGTANSFPAPSRLPSSPTDEPPPRTNEAKLTNHGGGPVSPDSDFFAEPPPEIGPVFSAYTSLTTSKRPWSLGARLVLTGLAGLVGLGIGSLVVVFARPREEFWQFFCPTVGSVVGVAICRALTRFSHTCSYVGRDGIAKFSCSGSSNRVKRSKVFLFRDAAEIRTGQTRQYNHGVYVGTKYFFTWTDAGGRQCHSVSGTYWKSSGTPPSTDAFHFGLAAETAWTLFLLAQAQRQMEMAGCIVFNLNGRQSLRLTPRGLTIAQGGALREWATDEIEAVVVDSGVLKIKRRDAKEGWFSSSGVAKFPFDRLANARLFLHLMGSLLGVRVG
jgi:hypothetical protein